MENQEKVPVVFISYCWSSEQHKLWVLNLAKRLVKESGVEIILDRWNLKIGHDRYKFMEESIKKADKVLVICDKSYCEKANDRLGGVGAETMIITPSVYNNTNQEKFIPISLEVMDNEFLLPDFFKSRYAIGIRHRDNYEITYKEIERIIWHEPILIPPTRGQKPDFKKEVLSKDKLTVQFIDSDNEERIIWLLPRGFLLFTDITYQNDTDWAVIVHYFDYYGQMQYGTHYHESYLKSWCENLFLQCRKLTIPETDWDWALEPLHFLMKLRAVKQNIDIQELVEKKRAEDTPVYYFKPKQNIPLPTVPLQYRYYYDTGKLRDILFELEEIKSGTITPKRILETALIIRQNVYLESLKYLGQNHPSFLFIKEIIDEFNQRENTLEIQLWLRKLTSILSNTLNYEREEWLRSL